MLPDLRRGLMSAIPGALACAALLVVACDDDPIVPRDDRTPAAGDPAAELPHETAAIPPGTPPALATPVEVSLREWEIAAMPAAVRAGTIFLLADNVGAESAHSLVVIRTDLAPDELPDDGGRVLLEELDVEGRVGPIELESSGSITVDLQPGRYVLICDIVEPAGTSHYAQGMNTGFITE